MRHHLVLRSNRASPPIHTGPSGKVALLAALTWPLSRPPALAHQHHLPFSKYAGATPGVGSLPSPPGASTLAFRVTRPAAPHPAAPRPGGFQLKHAPKRRSAFAGRPQAGPRRLPGSAAPAASRPAAGGGSPAPARRSPPSWGTPSACTAAADPEAAPRSPEPGPRQSEGPCPDAARRPGRCSST